MPLHLGALFALSSAVVTTSRGEETGFDKSFSYNGSNVFNYSYPGGNWSYIPCVRESTDIEQCNEMTGGAVTLCARLVPEGFNSEISFCRCVEPAGLSSKYCEPTDVRPVCFSGPDACNGPLRPQGYLNLIVYGSGSLFAIYSMCRMFTTVRKLWLLNLLETINGSTSLFAFIALIFLFFQAASWGVYLPLVKRYSHTPLFLTISSVFVVIALCNLAFGWIDAVRMARKMQATSGKNVSKTSKIFIAMYALVCAPAQGIVFGLNYIDLAAFFAAASMIGLGVIFWQGSRNLQKLLHASSLGSVAVPIQQASKSMAQYVCCYVCAAVAFVIVPPSQNPIINVATQSMVVVTIMCQVQMMNLIHKYVSTSVTKKNRVVAPETGNDTTMQSSADANTSSMENESKE